MADKNPVRGMQPMDDYEEMMYRRSPEGKAEMQRGAMKAIGAPAGIIVGGATAINALDSYRSGKKRDEELKAESKKSGIALDAENIKKDQKVEREYKGSGYKKGGKVSSASSRADGIAQRGKTRGKIC
jgi:hypothetical protein